MIYVSIDRIVYHKKEINQKLAKLNEMGCLLSFYTEVIRSAIGGLKKWVGKGLRSGKGEVNYRNSCFFKPKSQQRHQQEL